MSTRRIQTRAFCHNPTILAAGLFLLPTTASAQSPQITQARCDVGRSNALTSTLQPPLTMVWKTTTAAIPRSTQAPLYVGGTVYFADRKNVYAVRSADGTTLWTYSGNADFVAPPAIGGDALYIGSDDAHIYKLNLSNGSVIWSKGVSGPVRSSPAVANGRVFFGDENGDFYSFNAANGNEMWNFTAGGAVSSPAALSDDGKVFFAGADGKIYCLDGDTGKEEWELLFESDPSSTPPTYADGSLYVAAGRDLLSLNPNRGAVRWRTHFSRSITSSPAVGPDEVFVTTDDNKLAALNDHGNLLWSSPLGQSSSATPLIVGSMVVAVTDHGAIYAYDVNTGARVWDYVVQPSGTRVKPAVVNLTSSPIFVDNTLYVLADDGSLSAFRPQILDQAGPVVYNVTPAPGSLISAPDLTMGATVVDEGSGISPSSLTLTVDGTVVKAVTYDPASNGVRSTVDPTALPGPNTPAMPALKNGAHMAVLKIADWKGNVTTKTWSFHVKNAGAKTATEQAIEDSQTIVSQELPQAPAANNTGNGPIQGGNVPGGNGRGGNNNGNNNGGGAARGGGSNQGAGGTAPSGRGGGAYNPQPMGGNNPGNGTGAPVPVGAPPPAPPPPPI